MDTPRPSSPPLTLSHAECASLVLAATHGRVIHTLRGLPTAVPTRICLVNGTLLFTGDDDVVEAAKRRDVVSIQIDDATAQPSTWSVVVTGRVEVALEFSAPTSLEPALQNGATLLALPMTLLFGRRESDPGMSG